MNPQKKRIWDLKALGACKSNILDKESVSKCNDTQSKCGYSKTQPLYWCYIGHLMRGHNFI